MNPTFSSQGDSLPVSQLERIEAICTSFEDAWKAGQHPSLECFLSGVAAADQSSALRWLLLLELEYRRKSGEQPERAEYVSRFPEHGDVVRQVFDELDSRSAGGDDSQVAPDGGSRRPARVNSSTRFTILRPHAQGGLGQVSVALDQELNREVAFKEIQERYADDPLSRSRFLLEAEVTGGLEHPGVVPVYGLGQGADGRPYYAMRFIQGESLQAAIKRFHANGDPGNTVGEREKVAGALEPNVGVAEVTHEQPPPDESHAKSDAAAGGPNQRSFVGLEFRKLLGRFIDVCNAIEYAHSRGVLHRDLKPSNIMLGKFGETLVVDWGLAKAEARRPSPSLCDERPLHPASAGGCAPSQMGTAIGTPQYMSPEQAEGRLDDVGPATDVYSLGATLYCLLTGRAAFAADELPTVLERVAKGDFPPPRAINKYAPRALEAICLKAMSLRPADRYASCRGLADDVERWLADEPVSAWREPRAVRARRWRRKHRSWVRAGAAAVLMVAVMAAAALVVVDRARQKALANERKAIAAVNAESAAKQTALKRLRQIEKGNDILGSIFEDLDPSAAEKEGKQLQVILGERLDRATMELEGEAVGDPLAVAKLQMTLGNSQAGLGYPEKAIALLTRARETFTAELGPEHPDTLRSMNDLALAYLAAGQLEQALPLFEETLKLRIAKMGPEHPDTLSCINNLAVAYGAAGKFDQALPLLENVLKLQRAKLGADHPDTLTTMNNLANAYRAAGRLDQALPLFEETFELNKTKLGPEHPNSLASINNLAMAYQATGKLAKALPLLVETLKLRKAKLGPKHPDTLLSMENLANAYRAAGQLDQGLALFEETLKLKKAKLGPEHPDTLSCINNLAVAYGAAGKFDQALPLLEDVLKLQRAKLGADHPNTLTTMNNLAGAYHDAGEVDKALALFQETLKLMDAKLGPEHPDTLTSMNNVAVAYRAAGHLDQALPLFEETLKLRKAKLGAEHPSTLLSMNNLASAYRAAGQLDRALPLSEETLKLSKAELGPEHPETLRSINNLAWVYQDAGHLDQALPLFKETLKLRKAKLGAEHPDTLTNMNDLAVAYMAAGTLDQAMPLFEQTLKLRQVKLGAEHPETLKSINNLAGAYHACGKFDQALPLFEETLKLRKAKLGADHPDTLTNMNNLAVVYQAAGRFDQALPLFEETVRLQSGKLGPEHPETLVYMKNLAGANVEAKRYAEAAEMFQELLAIQRRKLPAGDPALAATLAQVGDNLLKSGQPQKAEAPLRECLEIRQQSEPDQWTTFNAQSLLGAALLARPAETR